MLFIGIVPSIAKSESKDQLVKYYESFIEKRISNCKAKTVLKTSRSENLQDES
jgi:hypothetical protein